MRATKHQDRRCLVCGKELSWPVIHFCSAACSETWVCKHREAEPVLTAPKGKA